MRMRQRVARVRNEATHLALAKGWITRDGLLFGNARYNGEPCEIVYWEKRLGAHLVDDGTYAISMSQEECKAFETDAVFAVVKQTAGCLSLVYAKEHDDDHQTSTEN